jgi:segregation and condensation protein B
MQTKIESLLFISLKPMTVSELFSFLKRSGFETSEEAVRIAVDKLKEKYNSGESGIHLVEAGDGFQFVTSPESSEIVKKFTKDEITGELTPASLETLTVIAYRGPIAKAELEQIRGVNCSLILRNLLIRGLIVSEENKLNLQPYFQVTAEFLKFLGIDSVESLPDYAKLHQAENLQEVLAMSETSETSRTIETSEVLESIQTVSLPPEQKIETPMAEVRKVEPTVETLEVAETEAPAPTRVASDDELY